LQEFAMLAYLDTLIGFAVVMLGASLIVMLLTQGVSAAGSFRGSSLRWGLRELFKQIDPRNLPTIAAKADTLAQQVLTRKLSSDSIFSSLPWIRKLVPDSWVQRFQLATAIRPDELVGILRHLAEDPSLGVLATEINQLLDRPNPVAERQIRLMTETSAALKALALDRAPALIAETVKTVRESAGYLEAGFNMAMDRVSQQFATYIRIWTIIFSFALAAGTGLDAVKLANDLYAKGDFRAALVGSAPGLIAVTEKILPPGAQSDQDAVTSAMSDLYTDAVNAALAKANVQPGAKPKGIETRDAGEAWIRHNVIDSTQQNAAINAYPAAVDQALGDFMKTRAANAKDIQKILKASGMQLTLGWPNGFNWKQLSGVLLSGALLSLGAPFWFNSLKAIMNLRPIIANKQAAEDKASA
jgi:hypothetical protein